MQHLPNEVSRLPIKIFNANRKNFQRTAIRNNIINSGYSNQVLNTGNTYRLKIDTMDIKKTQKRQELK
jgi:hypothetical protein